jgi:hypothetical protein
MLTPRVAIGIMRLVPSTASHIRPKTIVTVRAQQYTARTRKKKRSDVKGMAMGKRSAIPR